MNNQMIIFGGERDGQTVNEVWKFHFGKQIFRSHMQRTRVELDYVKILDKSYVHSVNISPSPVEFETKIIMTFGESGL